MQKDDFDPQLKLNVILSLQMENLMLKAQVGTLREMLEDSRREREEIESQLKALADRSHDPEKQLEMTRRCMEMQALFAASSRLLAAGTRIEVFDAVQDIVANLIGSEELMLFELNAERTRLQAAAWYGIAEFQRAPIAMGQGVIGEVASTGKAFFFSNESEPGPIACIPLRVETEVVGVLAIFSLLPQKLHLEPWDFEVLKLLEERLGGMLMNNNLQAKEGKS